MNYNYLLNILMSNKENLQMINPSIIEIQKVFTKKLKINLN